MKRGFTLIELLVVIAIIAILAAILFPVFAQAKIAAKKAVGISNQKQISYGLLLYTTDYDDYYPRQDSCAPNSSLNSELNGAPFPANGIGTNCTTGNFRYRVNHFSWQKYVMPYVRNVQLFEHPLREKDRGAWTTHGEIGGSFALNIGFTGASDTLDRPSSFLRQHRMPFLGGTTTSFPDPSAAALLMEIPGTDVAMVPSMSQDGPGVGVTVIVYPPAVREFWRYKLMKGSVTDCVNGTSGLEPDPTKIAAGGVVVGFADGSAKFLPAKQFLAKTPPKSEIFNTSGGPNAGWTFGNDCSNPAGNMGFSFINKQINYPMWGFNGE